MKYNYNVEQECFIREDGQGKKYHINITEAKRIVTLDNLGNTASEIRNKIQFQSNRVSESTITNFLNQIEKGNINLSGDYPAPVNVVMDLSVDERISNLEDRVKTLEDKFSELKSDCFVSAFAGEQKEPKKSWKQRLGL